MRLRGRRLGEASAFIAALALTLAGCGDDGDTAEAEATTTSTTSTAAPDTPTDEPGPAEPTPWPGNVIAATAAAQDAWIETPADAPTDGLSITATEPVGEPVAAPELGEAETLAAFELGPDGAVFDEPVIVSVVVPDSLLGDDGAVPAVSAAVSHAGGPYEGVDVTLSQDGARIVARAAVTEFSSIQFAHHRQTGIRLGGDHAVPLSLTWAAESVTFEITANYGGEDLRSGSFVESALFARDGAAWDWRAVPDGSLDLVARCTELGEGSYAVGVHLGGGVAMTNSGPDGPWAPVECKRLIAPLDPPDGFLVVYATCGGRFEELTNLDPDALAEAALGLGVAFEHRHYSEEACDSHNAGPPAELSGLGADLYITHFSFEAALRGDLGGENGADGKVYPEPLEDLSSLFIPMAAGAPDAIQNRQLTAFETWVVLHGAVRDRLDPAISDSGSIDWNTHPVLGLEPIDVGGFEAVFQEQWNTPLE